MDLIAVMLNLLALNPDGPFGPISFMIKHINMLDQVLLAFIKSSAQKTEIARAADQLKQWLSTGFASGHKIYHWALRTSQHMTTTVCCTKVFDAVLFY